MEVIKYYAYALNEQGKIEQVLVRRKYDKGQKWTGKIYKNEKEADEDMIRLNCK